MDSTEIEYMKIIPSAGGADMQTTAKIEAMRKMLAEYRRLKCLAGAALKVARRGRYCAEDLMVACRSFDDLEAAIQPNAKITGPGEKP
jgi:hypothetical protein